MANEGDRGSNPGHPRMTAGLPPGPGGTLEKLSETAGQVRDKIRDAASGVAERAEQGAEAIARTAQDFWTDAGNLIRRNPMASVAIAFGVGCLVGAALTAAWGRRQDDMIRGMSRASA
jgi:ElaB/YqjD/DUF883 family membrane-anchored ribosome-binding protein